jgi:3D (Asp-Asp-Asp) domain-containing protein
VIAVLATAGVLAASSTSYCPGSSGQVMADGTHVRLGSAASNRHPLGTRLRLIGVRFLGRRTFVVRDRIGSGSQLDLWSPSCTASRRWGRRRVRYRVIRHG